MKKAIMVVTILPLTALLQMYDGLQSLTESTAKQEQSAPFLEGVKKWKERYNEKEGSGSM
jgi:hypothetical protein